MASSTDAATTEAGPVNSQGLTAQDLSTAVLETEATLLVPVTTTKTFPAWYQPTRMSLLSTTFVTSGTASEERIDSLASLASSPLSTSAATPSLESNASTDSSSSLSIGTRVGIGLGAAVALLLIVNVAFLLLRRNRRPTKQERREFGFDNKAELDDQTRRHEIDGESAAPWWNRWRSGMRRTMRAPGLHELSGDTRVELPENTAPQELGADSCSPTCGTESECGSRSSFVENTSVSGNCHSDLRLSMTIFDEPAPQDVRAGIHLASTVLQEQQQPFDGKRATREDDVRTSVSMLVGSTSSQRASRLA